MAPYLNQYVNYALAPQIQGQNQQFAAQDQQLNSAATAAGAFGDARAGIQAANLTNQQNLARQGLIGNAYNAAFNTAIGAGAQDVANNLTGQTTNASLAQQYLQNQLTGANALQGNIGFQNQLGQQQTAQGQAQLNAAYNQWLMGQQYPFQTTQNLNSALQSGTYAMPPTQTVSQPDNSGFQALGAIGGAALNYFLPGAGSALQFGMGALQGQSPTGNADNWSDERLKENIKTIGKTDEGLPIKLFNYKADPDKRPIIGLMAQDVEKVKPEAVKTDPVSGYKMVNYEKATSLASALGIG